MLTDDGFQPVSADIALESAFFSGEKLRELLECLTGIRAPINTRMKNLAIR